MDKLLIYINCVGPSYDGKYSYEFMFTDDIEGVDGENWDTYPASGLPEPPLEYTNSVRVIKTDLKLTLIQNSDTFSLWDAVDDVIALAWEETKDYDEYPDVRISFKFGETIESIENKLYQKELAWHGKEIIINEHQE